MTRTTPTNPMRRLRNRLRLGTRLRCLVGMDILPKATLRIPTEFHGSTYGGWAIVAGSLSPDDMILDLGVGEDASFALSLIQVHGVSVQAYDPTDRAEAYIKDHLSQRLKFIKAAVGPRDGSATFFPPKNPDHVSGSLTPSGNVTAAGITVPVVSLAKAHTECGSRVQILKMDIEGSEYDLLADPTCQEIIRQIPQVLVEFHHKQPGFEARQTKQAIQNLTSLGFAIFWVSESTNEVGFTARYHVR